MATTIKDSRIVRVSLTYTEMASLLGQKAQEAGFINFTPDKVEVFDQGNNSFEAVFEKDTI
jgi:hypothetical protein